LEPFVKLARSIRRQLAAIHDTLGTRMSNVLIEDSDTQLRLLNRQAHGYHVVETLIAMATLRRDGLCPPLPGLA
jgi:transposase